MEIFDTIGSIDIFDSFREFSTVFDSFRELLIYYVRFVGLLQRFIFFAKFPLFLVESFAKIFYLCAYNFIAMNIKESIRQKIEKTDGEAIFFISDFTHNGNDVFISRLLSEFVAEGLIARVGNGVYYKPIKTRFGNLAPGIDTIAKAIARRDRAEIMPTGQTAENMLGLSTQIPMNYVYLTSGSARKINLDNVTITFKRCVPKNFAYNDKFFAILIQAMKSIGQRNITKWHISKIEQLLTEHIDPITYSHDLVLAPIWIKKILRQLNK